MPTVQLRGEWDLVPGWRRGSAFTPATVALVVLVVAGLGHFNDLPWWPAVIAGVGGVVAVAVVSVGTGSSRGITVYRVICIACVGTWVAWAQESSPFDARLLAFWLGGSAVLGGTATTYGKRNEAAAARRAVDLPLAERAQQAEEWTDLLWKACRVKVAEIVAIQAWPPTRNCAQPGYTVEARLADGATWEDVAPLVRKLASRLRLPYGCGVEASEGNGADLALIRVSTYDTLGEPVLYPEDFPERSANDDYDIGVRRDGKSMDVNTRENSVLIGGRKGSGKTTAVYCFLCRAAEMVDIITCVIDLKGDVIKPFVAPYIEGRAEYPVIDWPARTPEQGIRMCKALIRAGKARAASAELARLKREHNTNMPPFSPDYPQFTLYVDEGKGISGSSVTDKQLVELAQLVETVREMYRGQGINVVFTSLRTIATALGGTDARVQSAILMLMHSKTEEIRNTFDETAGITAADTPHPGNGLIAEDSNRPVSMSVYNVLPDAIDRIAVACSGRHPAPEPAALRAMGADWDARWDMDNVGWLYEDADMDTVPMATDTPSPDADDPMAGVQRSLGTMNEIADRLRRKYETDDEPDDADTDAVFDEIAARFDDDGKPAVEPGPQRMMSLLYEAGPVGMSEAAIFTALRAEGLTKSRQAIGKWLRAAVMAGHVAHPTERGPYIHSGHAR